MVASEVGDQKREIVYFGDTVNTAARLCAACKELGKDVLISAELMGHADVPTGAQSEPLAPLALRGKNQPIDVLALSER